MSKTLSFEFKRADHPAICLGFIHSTFVVVVWPFQFRVRWGY